VETLVDSYQKAGLHHLSFDASNLKSGLYFYKLTYDDVSLTRSMIRSK
jgi:hypothetical protein